MFTQFKDSGITEKFLEISENAIEEYKAYKEIGTVEEYRKAMEKQIPKNPNKYIANDGIERNGCPNCYETKEGNEILYAGQKYCSVCGRAIDWSE